MIAAKPICKPGLTVKDIGGEALLYSADEEAIHILNPTAQLIWELCDGTRTITDMEQTIRTNFFVSTEYDVRQDIRHALAIFVDKGLLQ